MEYYFNVFDSDSVIKDVSVLRDAFSVTVIINVDNYVALLLQCSVSQIILASEGFKMTGMWNLDLHVDLSDIG